MHHKEILATITIAHHFGSAFSRVQLYNFLRFEMDERAFHSAIDELIGANIVSEKDTLLFTEDIVTLCHQKKDWSKSLFKKHRKYLLLISKIPWVKYMGLTGANSFESCNETDDIDLFIITSPNRLWICYLILVFFTKLIGKRETLCINYLVDENNLAIQEENYFTALQMIQMMPVYDSGIHRRLIHENPWIFKVLPNATLNGPPDGFYRLDSRTSFKANGNHFNLFTQINRMVYDQYSKRLKRKFPDSFGNGIQLREGMAKLNRIDNNDVYEKLFSQIYEAMNP